MWLVRTSACSANLVPYSLLPLNLNPLYLILGCLLVDGQVYRRLQCLGVESKTLSPLVFEILFGWEASIVRWLLARATYVCGKIWSLVYFVVLWNNQYIAWSYFAFLFIEFKLNLYGFDNVYLFKYTLFSIINLLLFFSEPLCCIIQIRMPKISASRPQHWTL
jgi:hypothetical protein